MCSAKLIPVLALISAVTAAVTINVYDDDNDIGGELSSCNVRACEQLCRRLGLPGGVCVGDRCKCDNFLAKEGTYKVDGELRSCNLRACEQLCRRLGFPGGVCVGDRCKCDNFLAADLEHSWTDIKIQGSTNNVCSPLECKMRCRDGAVPGGECDGGRCDCGQTEVSDKEEEEWNKNIQKSVRGCDVVACNTMCRRLNYMGGMCRFGSCHCY